MAYQSVWYFTDIPSDVINIIETDIKKYFDSSLENSKLHEGVLDTKRRKSKNTWIPTTHWVSGFLWHYVMMANKENFLYDLKSIDAETLQYTVYEEGNFYNWHNDAGLQNAHVPSNSDIKSNFINENCELVRKLSFSLQLSDPEDYDGGHLQLLDEEGKSYIAPKRKGSLILFDSRTPHRVRKVTRGIRKSIVGWVVGPRWK
jgi:predicted 2-oxoglutarate/Fe(II)-dependent dioxygenase YbiX